MAAIIWTPQQQAAIETVDRNVVVSAAAGSGKTAVLAARCAYLVCDAPPPHRCDVDQLLVVTFTEAAAAEMKQRIHKALRERGSDPPDDPQTVGSAVRTTPNVPPPVGSAVRTKPSDSRARAQAAMVDAAQISTLHGFCLWMVRRWFHRAGVDATAQVLDEGEAELLRRDVLDTLFNELYAAAHARADGFRRLVDDYGLGHDGEIAAFVLRLAAFLTSLPEPNQWLAMARDTSDGRLAAIIEATRAALRLEVGRQADYCAEIAEHIRRDLPFGTFYGHLVGSYADMLCHWRDELDQGRDGNAVRGEISAVALSSKGAPRLSKDAPPEVLQQRDSARDLFNEVKTKLHEKRLKGQLCRFNAEQMVAGIFRIQPYVRTLADLAAEFSHRYDNAKRALGVMDFSDLERKAYELLTGGPVGPAPNPIAAELRNRFAHVLVDEFQDINPLQARLLALVSREDDDRRAGNLFTVGDVKQSIYRFRLAEPGMFLVREKAYRTGDGGGVCIDLQRNYRSRRTILDGVNEIFRRLMQAECGGIAYDEHAELRSPDPDADPGPAIELHILERAVRPEGDEEDDDTTLDADESEAVEERFVDAADPVQWRSVEREAFLIGTHIRRMMRDGVTVTQHGRPRPLRYKDICVLLRSTRHSAAPLADMLTQMGIPAWTDATGDLLSALEVGDVLSLLTVLDNLQQDIPLAAVLRSGVLGDQLNEDELVEIRVFDREGAFHEAVRGYRQRGPREDLRGKLAALLGRLDRYRKEARLQPLADVLWMIYRETGYLAYVGGLRGGEQRRANLITLHERARQFGQFRRQGLRRFLHFIEASQAEQAELGSPSSIGEADDVVRIMSIHKSKGLEFPVVFCAELGRAFNLGDTRGRFLFDRQVGIGLKVVEPDRLIEYPTALHQWCARSSHEASIAEELRVWYVAMTRAQERLILVGTEPLDTVERDRSATGRENARLNPLTILTVRAPLQWVIPALGLMTAGKLLWNQTAPAGPDALFAVTTHPSTEIQAWSLPPSVARDAEPVRRAVAALDPLPGSEPLSGEATQAEEIIGRLEFVYPYLALSSMPAARAASEANRDRATAADTEERAPIVRHVEVNSTAGRGDAAQAVHRGQVVHTALQFIRLERTSNERDIAAEIGRLRDENIIAASDVPLIDTSALEWFHNSALGQRIRAGADRYHREWMFLAAESAELFDPAVNRGEEDRVLVRGVVDGLLATDRGVEIVDFKTDRVPPEGVEARALAYATQMRLYTAAVERVFGPVINCHLVFLHSRRIVEVEGTPN